VCMAAPDYAIRRVPEGNKGHDTILVNFTYAHRALLDILVQ